MVSHNVQKKVEYGAWLSITAYILLTFFKLLVGYIAQSKALTADGLNNSTDILLSVAILIGIRIARKPPDANHTYGHSKAESIASLAASFIMVSVGLNIILKSIQQLFLSPSIIVVPDTLAAWTAIFCALVMYFVYRFNYKVANQTNSSALLSAAKDNLSDAWVSIGAAIGIFAAQWNMPWLDPLAACIVGILICKTAWEIFQESSRVLTDGFDEGALSQFTHTIMLIKGVRVVDDIRARSYGSDIFVDVVIHVDPEINIIESHHICNQIEQIMLDRHQVSNVHIHIEPYINVS
ncbi:cation diffusion facilitator family transporter [Ammoniphilus sp. CFH 90114]|uniref:cation diffusion facilitator family transporter n=1 Tax=Ammoniphilus sp. CFH 90114 TaxID=2493665 RepID=UPI00100EEAF8|nr:cation diffusion facilitator family transporter [Ammoniphilus sp. CFH 90114]RXT03610.1 cation transporter [Ammoniphilus sp. CFH 90114]